MGILIVFVAWALLYGMYVLRHFVDTPHDWLWLGGVVAIIAVFMPDVWLKRLMAMIAWTRGQGSLTRKLWEWWNHGKK